MQLKRNLRGHPLRGYRVVGATNTQNATKMMPSGNTAKPRENQPKDKPEDPNHKAKRNKNNN
jgi:hypothetical protein